MNPRRRHLLMHLAAWPSVATAATAATTAPKPEVATEVKRGRVLEFPRDHGAHPPARTEWWYATGWLGSADQPTHGFQVTFFRSRTGLAEGVPGRFAARQLLFAHAAVTVLAERRHAHDQRITRWTGEPGAVPASASSERGDVRLAQWFLRDQGAAWETGLQARDFSLALALRRTQQRLQV